MHEAAAGFRTGAKRSAICGVLLCAVACGAPSLPITSEPTPPSETHQTSEPDGIAEDVDTPEPAPALEPGTRAEPVAAAPVATELTTAQAPPSPLTLTLRANSPLTQLDDEEMGALGPAIDTSREIHRVRLQAWQQTGPEGRVVYIVSIDDSMHYPPQVARLLPDGVRPGLCGPVRLQRVVITGTRRSTLETVVGESCLGTGAPSSDPESSASYRIEVAELLQEATLELADFTGDGRAELHLSYKHQSDARGPSNVRAVSTMSALLTADSLGILLELGGSETLPSAPQTWIHQYAEAEFVDLDADGVFELRVEHYERRVGVMPTDTRGWRIRPTLSNLNRPDLPEHQPGPLIGERRRLEWFEYAPDLGRYVLDETQTQTLSIER